MKLTFTYGQHVMALPVTVAEHIDKATKSDIRILLELAADPLSFVDLSLAKERVAARCKRSVAAPHALSIRRISRFLPSLSSIK